MVTQSAHELLPAGVFAPYEVVRALGSRAVPVYVVRQVAAPGAKAHLVVAERFVGAATGPDGHDSEFLKEARRIATLASTNVPRVREVAMRGPDVVAFTEYVDGEKLDALLGHGPGQDGLPLEIALRVIVDVLTALGTLHGLRDAKQQPLRLAHGEISPATVVLGQDGIGRVLHAIARRAPSAQPDPASRRALAPEVLTSEPHDQRADVYGAGALLWEALSGQPMPTDADPLAAAARIRAEGIPRATVPAKAPWAKDLVQVAAKALSASPDDRWPNVTVMAGELRKAAGLKLAPASTTAAFAKGVVAERARARRHALETQAPIVPASRPVSVVPRVAPVVPASVAPRPPPFEAAQTDEVIVAPGVVAQVTEAIELGSESLLDSDSLPDIPPPSAPSREPFFVAAPPSEPPPPPPAPIAPEPFAPPPAVTAPPAPPVVVLEAAPAPAKLDVIPRPRPREMMETLPSMARLSELDAATRRRKVLILGGVGALGGLIFVLALTRWALRDKSTHEQPHPVAALVASAPPAPAPPAAIAPQAVADVAPTPVARSPSLSPASATLPPPSAPSVARPVAAAPPAAPRIPAAAARPRPTPVARPAAPRPKRPKPAAFEPSTL